MNTINQPELSVPNNACAPPPFGTAFTVTIRPRVDRLAIVALLAYQRGLPDFDAEKEWDSMTSSHQESWRQAVRAVVSKAEEGIRDALLTGKL